MKIPKIILQNKENLRFYIRGLYDADGTLPKDAYKTKMQFIDITLKDKGIILELRQVLTEFGIKTLKPYCRIARSPNSDYISHTWEIRIRRRYTMIKFLKEIGFSHPNKAKRAKKLLCYLDP